MNLQTKLQTCALTAAQHGDWQAARYVLRSLADRKGWCDETYRARWDGGAALLAWWHQLDVVQRPPLDDLKAEDARAFLDYLEGQGLARSTIRGYRTGAAALTYALRACKVWPVAFDAHYAPFRSVHLQPVKQPSADTKKTLTFEQVDSPLAKARLELLLALMALGLSLPEVCSRYWQDVNTKDRLIVGYRGRVLGYGVAVVTALDTFTALRPRQYGGQRLLGWSADTARRWLKQLR